MLSPKKHFGLLFFTNFIQAHCRLGPARFACMLNDPLRHCSVCVYTSCSEHQVSVFEAILVALFNCRDKYQR